MNILKDKDLLIKAISHYSIYTKKQRTFLQYLINMSFDEEVKFHTNEAAENLKLSRAAIYMSLNKFIKEGLLSKKKETGERINSYTINIDKLNYILEFYYKKLKNN